MLNTLLFDNVRPMGSLKDGREKDAPATVHKADQDEDQGDSV